MKKYLVLLLLILSGVFLAGKIYATSPNPPWCHCEPNGNCQTLYLPNQALEQAGHVDASGSPLHAGDHAGECLNPTATATPTSTATATATATNQPTATATNDPCDGDCNEPTETPTSTPQATETPNGDICANIEGIQTSIPEGKHLDAGSENCVEFSVPGVEQASGSNANGLVLGASTMAGTGAVEDAIFNSIFTLGSLLTSFGIMKNGKKKN
jgi:hypothetical protein